MVTDNRSTSAHERERGTLPTENRYCATCLRTERFLDLGHMLQCPTCARRLHRVEVRLPETATARVA